MEERLYGSVREPESKGNNLRKERQFFRIRVIFWCKALLLGDVGSVPRD